MALQDAFSLTPRESYLNLGPGNDARVYVQGVSHLPKITTGDRHSFDHQHASDELLFLAYRVGDATADYTQISELRQVPHVML